MARVEVKVVLLGQQGVGKSALVDRYVNDVFEEAQRNTIGAAFAAKKITISDGHSVSLGIWDTAGAERFESISRMYYNGAKAAVVCFNPTNAKSFEKLKFWVEELQHVQPDCKIYIAMTKCDLMEDWGLNGHVKNDDDVNGNGPHAENDDDVEGVDKGNAGPANPSRVRPTTLPTGPLQRVVSQEDVDDYAMSVGRGPDPVPVFATSARYNLGIDTLFRTIAEDLKGSSKSADRAAAADALDPPPLLRRRSTAGSQAGLVTLPSRGAPSRERSWAACCGLA